LRAGVKEKKPETAKGGKRKGDGARSEKSGVAGGRMLSTTQKKKGKG